MRNAACLEGPDVLLREVGSEIGESPEEQADVLGLNGDPGAGTVAHLPSTFGTEPVDEGGYRMWRASINANVRDIARTVRLGYRERHDRGLSEERRHAALEGKIVGDHRFESGVDELLER